MGLDDISFDDFAMEPYFDKSFKNVIPKILVVTFLDCYAPVYVVRL